MPRHTTQTVKEGLKAKGWSHREAADFLGRSRETVTRVLNGQRQSRSLIAKLAALPARKASTR